MGLGFLDFQNLDLQEDPSKSLENFCKFYLQKIVGNRTLSRRCICGKAANGLERVLDRCSGRCDMTRIILKTASYTKQTNQKKYKSQGNLISHLNPFPNDKFQLVVWCLTPFSTVSQLYHGNQCTYPCFPGVLLTSTIHNILSKPLATFPHNHYCKNRQG